MADEPDHAKTALDHAWDWFSLHATQRLQSVNFYLIAIAFLSAAFVTAVKEKMDAVAAGVAVLAIATSFFFYRMERRIRSLIHAAEGALGPLQDSLANTLNIPALRIVATVEAGNPGEWKYSKVFRYLYFTTALMFGLGLLYVSWDAFKSAPTNEFKLTLEALIGTLMILCGYELLSGSSPRPKVDDLDKIRRWAVLVFGIIFIVFGISVFIHLVFIH